MERFGFVIHYLNSQHLRQKGDIIGEIKASEWFPTYGCAQKGKVTGYDRVASP